MKALGGPWSDLALLLRQAVTQTDRETGSFVPLWLFALPLFLSVCLLLLQLIVYLSWKLRQVEADLAQHSQDGRALCRQTTGRAHLRRRAGSQTQPWSGL